MYCFALLSMAINREEYCSILFKKYLYNGIVYMQYVLWSIRMALFCSGYVRCILAYLARVEIVDMRTFDLNHLCWPLRKIEQHLEYPIVV